MLRMKAREPDHRLSSTKLAISALVLAALNLALHWPGTLTPDSKNQLGQVLAGAFTDWHPPLMAKLWALLGGAVQAMLAVQVGLHWLASGRWLRR